MRLPLLLFAAVVGLVILTVGFASTYVLGSGTEHSGSWLVIVGLVTVALFAVAALVCGERVARRGTALMSGAIVHQEPS